VQENNTNITIEEKKIKCTHYLQSLQQKEKLFFVFWNEKYEQIKINNKQQANRQYEKCSIKI